MSVRSAFLCARACVYMCACSLTALHSQTGSLPWSRVKRSSWLRPTLLGELSGENSRLNVFSLQLSRFLRTSQTGCEFCLLQTWTIFNHVFSIATATPLKASVEQTFFTFLIIGKRMNLNQSLFGYWLGGEGRPPSWPPVAVQQKHEQQSKAIPSFPEGESRNVKDALTSVTLQLILE